MYFVYFKVVYNLAQCAAYTIMAIMIMRLKLFMTPHLCIVTALLASKKVCRNRADINSGQLIDVHGRK